MDEEESKSWLELEPEGPQFDLRGMGPVHECICGSDLFKVICSFEDGELTFYLLEAECALCGSWLEVPTPDYEEED